MFIDSSFPRYDADQWNLLHDAARARAQALRDEAIEGFWHSTGVALARGVSASQRAANRLAARLRQHAKQREAAPASQACR
jgi:hypothetical protein